MTKIFTLDHGNSNPHVGVFSDTEKSSPNEIIPLDQFVPKKEDIIICSSVGNQSQLNFEVTHDLSTYFQNGSFFSLKVNYERTLGMDRLVQAYYLSKVHPDQDICLIDSGTFITIDFLINNEHQGGHIIPGEKAYFSTFPTFGAKLPQIETSGKIQERSIFVNTTHDAIEKGYHYLLQSLQETLHEEGPKRTYLTGGMASKLIPLFPEAILDPDLIHKSLKFIYLENLIN